MNQKGDTAPLSEWPDYLFVPGYQTEPYWKLDRQSRQYKPTSFPDKDFFLSNYRVWWNTQLFQKEQKQQQSKFRFTPERLKKCERAKLEYYPKKLTASLDFDDDDDDDMTQPPPQTSEKNRKGSVPIPNGPQFWTGPTLEEEKKRREEEEKKRKEEEEKKKRDKKKFPDREKVRDQAPEQIFFRVNKQVLVPRVVKLPIGDDEITVRARNAMIAYNERIRNDSELVYNSEYFTRYVPNGVTLYYSDVYRLFRFLTPSDRGANYYCDDSIINIWFQMLVTRSYIIGNSYSLAGHSHLSFPTLEAIDTLDLLFVMRNAKLPMEDENVEDEKERVIAHRQNLSTQRCLILNSGSNNDTIVLIPFNLHKNHWVLFAWQRGNKNRVYLYDSMPSQSHYDELREIFMEIAQCISERRMDYNQPKDKTASLFNNVIQDKANLSWVVDYVTKPGVGKGYIQQGGTACGYMVCWFAYYLSNFGLEEGNRRIQNEMNFNKLGDFLKIMIGSFGVGYCWKYPETFVLETSPPKAEPKPAPKPASKPEPKPKINLSLEFSSQPTETGTKTMFPDTLSQPLEEVWEYRQQTKEHLPSPQTEAAPNDTQGKNGKSGKKGNTPSVDDVIKMLEETKNEDEVYTILITDYDMEGKAADKLIDEALAKSGKSYLPPDPTTEAPEIPMDIDDDEVLTQPMPTTQSSSTTTESSNWMDKIKYPEVYGEVPKKEPEKMTTGVNPRRLDTRAAGRKRSRNQQPSTSKRLAQHTRRNAAEMAESNKKMDEWVKHESSALEEIKRSLKEAADEFGEVGEDAEELFHKPQKKKQEVMDDDDDDFETPDVYISDDEESLFHDSGKKGQTAEERLMSLRKDLALYGHDFDKEHKSHKEDSGIDEKELGKRLRALKKQVTDSDESLFHDSGKKK